MSAAAKCSTEEQLAEMLQIEPYKMAELRREKRLPHLRLGRKVRYTPEQVALAIEAVTVRPEPIPAGISGLSQAALARRKRRAS